jgi:hypothetical protein
MGHREHWRITIYTGERSKNSPWMHKQRNREKALEGRGSGRKHREPSGDAELRSLVGPELDRA